MNDLDARAWDLWRDLRLQRAKLRSYEEALFFTRVRNVDAKPVINESVARRLWEISQECDNA